MALLSLAQMKMVKLIRSMNTAELSLTPQKSCAPGNQGAKMRSESYAPL